MVNIDKKDIERLMSEAIRQAKIAYKNDEVPIGAVVADSKGKIIGAGHNKVEQSLCSTKHAEIVAIEDASKNINNWRLDNHILCITAEPCTMCTGAILNSRIPVVVFGASQHLMGAMGGLYDLTLSIPATKRPRVIQGIMETECRELLEKFFKSKR